MKRSKETRTSSGDAKIRKVSEEVTKMPISNDKESPNQDLNSEALSESSQVDAKSFVQNMSVQAEKTVAGPASRSEQKIETQRISSTSQTKVIDQSDRMKVQERYPSIDENDSVKDKGIPTGIDLESDLLDASKFDQFSVDPNLHNGPRILVPVDVQAFVVPKNSTPFSSARSKSSEPSSSWPVPLSDKSIKSSNPVRADLHVTKKEKVADRAIYGLPNPFDQETNPATSLEPGVHLFWSLPDALMRGEEKEESREIDEYMDLDEEIPSSIAGSRAGISYGEAINESLEFEAEDDAMDLSDFNFPQLPDRWLIVRQWKHAHGTIMTKKWVLESNSGESETLDTWTSPGKSGTMPELTAVGPGVGDIYWTVTYDSARNRFTFHDIPEDQVNGPFDYLVSGWYSDETRDPLWMPMSTPETEWMRRFEDELRWKLPIASLGGMVDGDREVSFMPVKHYDGGGD